MAEGFRYIDGLPDASIISYSFHATMPVFLIFSVCVLNFYMEGKRQLFTREEKSLMNRRVPNLAVATSVSIFTFLVIALSCKDSVL